MARSKLRTALAVGGAAAIGARTALRRANARWERSVDATNGDPWYLPDGHHTQITTSDGATLALTHVGKHGPSQPGPSEPGPGEPSVVLSHCWMGARQVWGHVAQRLADDGHHVVLYDQRGHGESTLGSDPISIERLGDDLAEILAALELGSVVLGGHSMGGMTVMAYAGRHREDAARRVAGSVLSSTSARRKSLTKRDGDIGEAVLSGKGFTWNMSRPVLGRALVRRQVGDVASAATLDAIRSMTINTPPEVRGPLARAMTEMDLRAHLEHFSWPTRVVVGSKDTLTVPAWNEEIAELIDGASFHVAEGCSHMLPMEAPGLLADALAELASAASVEQTRSSGERATA